MSGNEKRFVNIDVMPLFLPAPHAGTYSFCMCLRRRLCALARARFAPHGMRALSPGIVKKYNTAAQRWQEHRRPAIALHGQNKTARAEQNGPGM